MHKHHHTTEMPARPASAKSPCESEKGVTSEATGQVQKVKAKAQAVVRDRAYQKWEAAGKPNGDGVTFWLEAEQELTQAKVAPGGRRRFGGYDVG